MRKAQGLSLTTVVIAALALLVLVILSVIFVGRMGRVSEGSQDCLQLGGTCYDATQGQSCRTYGDMLIPHPNAQCLMQGPDGNRVPDSSRICCIPAG